MLSALPLKPPTFAISLPDGRTMVTGVLVAPFRATSRYRFDRPGLVTILRAALNQKFIKDPI